jgi:hypothetical protein
MTVINDDISSTSYSCDDVYNAVSRSRSWDDDDNDDGQPLILLARHSDSPDLFLVVAWNIPTT